MQEIQLPSRQIFPDFREAQAISLITNPELSSGKVFGLHAQNRKTRKSSSVQTIIQGQKPEPMVQCVRKSARIRRGPESRCVLRRATYCWKARPATRQVASLRFQSTAMPVSCVLSASLCGVSLVRRYLRPEVT